MLTSPVVDQIAFEVLWHRLLAILEETAWTIVRSSFSSAIREAWDFSCLLYDRDGRLIAQNAGVSGKIGVWHTSIPHILERFPAGELQSGDVIISNDPWLTEGHLYDTTMVMPIIRNGQLIGFGECIAHLSDIGGAITNEAKDIFEEGLQIPLCKFAEGGRENRLVRAFIEENVRTPDYAMGDLRALVAALTVTEAKVQRLLDEYRLPDLQAIADGIIARTEAATREGIRRLPTGDYEYQVEGDGFDTPTVLKARITVGDGGMRVDFTGSSPQSKFGVNCPLNYATAWTVFAIKTIVSPNVPNNLGSFLPIDIVAPRGSILNPQRPAPVRMRAATAHYITPVIHGALALAAPDRAIAESGAPGFINRFFGEDGGGKPFAVLLGLAGGMGARSSADGPHCVNYPSNMAATSVEVLEEIMPIRVLEKSLIPDSGGAGRYRGGCGQRFVMLGLGPKPIRTLLQHERIGKGAPGVAGGQPGRPGQSRLNGQILPSKTQIEIGDGDVLDMETAGGGGMFAPSSRSKDALQMDMRAGLVTEKSANEEYGR